MVSRTSHHRRSRAVEAAKSQQAEAGGRWDNLIDLLPSIITYLLDFTLFFKKNFLIILEGLIWLRFRIGLPVRSEGRQERFRRREAQAGRLWIRIAVWIQIRLWFRTSSSSCKERPTRAQERWEHALCNVKPAHIIISFNGWVVAMNGSTVDGNFTWDSCPRISGILDKYIRILKDTFLFASFSKRRNLHQSHEEGNPNQLQKGLLHLHQTVIGEFGLSVPF